MPPVFRFRVHHNIVFQGQLVSERCTAQTRAGHRCSRQTVIGCGLCWSHLLSERHLRIQQSTIPHAGKGLFAQDRTAPAHRVIFHAGATICDYNGQVINLAQLNARYGLRTAPYGMRINANRFEDGGLHRGIGSIANQNPPHQVPNARYTLYHIVGVTRCRLSAIIPIRNNQEIFIDYGGAYIMHDAAVQYSTTPR